MPEIFRRDRRPQPKVEGEPPDEPQMPKTRLGWSLDLQKESSIYATKWSESVAGFFRDRAREKGRANARSCLGKADHWARRIVRTGPASLPTSLVIVVTNMFVFPPRWPDRGDALGHTPR